MLLHHFQRGAEGNLGEKNVIESLSAHQKHVLCLKETPKHIYLFQFCTLVYIHTHTHRSTVAVYLAWMFCTQTENYIATSRFCNCTLFLKFLYHFHIELEKYKPIRK